MISGPTLPGTRDAVWQLVRNRVDRLERGLRLAVDDLEVAPGAVIDGLCRDADGQPVAVLSASASDGDAFAGQVLTVQRFLREAAQGLAGLLPDCRVRFTGNARVMVVGTEPSAVLRDVLVPMAADGVELFRLHSVRVGGELRWMVQPLLGPQAEGGGSAGNAVAKAQVGGHRIGAGDPGDPEHGLQVVPEGVVDQGLRSVCHAFLRVAARLDPGVTVRGDRFSRIVEYGGERLAELQYVDRRVLVLLPGGVRVELLTQDDALAAADGMIRFFLATTGAWGDEVEAPAGDGCVEAPSEPVAGGALDPQASPESIRELHESILASRLTPEEGEALASGELWTPEMGGRP